MINGNEQVMSQFMAFLFDLEENDIESACAVTKEVLDAEIGWPYAQAGLLRGDSDNPEHVKLAKKILKTYES
jgi:hypothetical protein